MCLFSLHEEGFVPFLRAAPSLLLIMGGTLSCTGTRGVTTWFAALLYTSTLLASALAFFCQGYSDLPLRGVRVWVEGCCLACQACLLRPRPHGVRRSPHLQNKHVVMKKFEKMNSSLPLRRRPTHALLPLCRWPQDSAKSQMLRPSTPTPPPP